MNQNQRDKGQTENESKEDTALERLAKKIDPPSREVRDDELSDPGRMTPGAPPAKNKS